MIVNPGFFRTELLTEQSTNYAAASHRGLRRGRGPQQLEFWKGYNGKQSGDPAKLAQALLTHYRPEMTCRAASLPAPMPSARREQKVAALQQQIDAHRELSKSLAFAEVSAGRGS